MRTYHIDQDSNRVLATDHPSVRAHWLARGLKLAATPRAARQYAMRYGSECQMVNANWHENHTNERA